MGEILVRDMYKGEYSGFIPAVKILEHPEYSCSFCSHGETIKLKTNVVYPRMFGASSIHQWYLEFEEGCFTYSIGAPYYSTTLSEEEAIIKAKDIFSKIIKFNKDERIYRDNGFEHSF